MYYRIILILLASILIVHTPWPTMHPVNWLTYTFLAFTDSSCLPLLFKFSIPNFCKYKLDYINLNFVCHALLYGPFGTRVIGLLFFSITSWRYFPVIDTVFSLQIFFVPQITSSCIFWYFLRLPNVNNIQLKLMSSTALAGNSNTFSWHAFSIQGFRI
jgi:hypothetical protein